MKTKTIASILLGMLACGASTASAAVIFTDDFNRANVALTSTGSNIGANYVITQSTGAAQFQITSNQLASGGTAAGNSVLSYQGLQLQNTGVGESFNLSLDVTTLGINSNSLLYGLVFNYTDANNYYAARISTGATAGTGNFQLIQNVGGTITGVANIANLSIATSDVYTMTISSNTAGTFGYTLNGTGVNISGTWTDASSPMSDGFAGVHISSANATPKFDNFSVTTVPEPATVAMIGIGLTFLLWNLRRRRTQG
jgi:hypothetical protein